MKKMVLLGLGFLMAAFMISCKKSNGKEAVELNTALVEDNKKIQNIQIVAKESVQNKIDLDWSKMNYNILSSVLFDVQTNPEKYNGKRIKAYGNYQTSVYEGSRYFSILMWDPTGCCPTGFDFVPPANMKFPDDFPANDTKISMTCVFRYSEENGREYFKFLAEKIDVE